MPRFNRVLVSNRAEIALRVIRALESLGIESVAVYSDADIDALHARQADRAFNIAGVYPSDTYLDADKIIEIARRADCDAIHPGYGFLSENSGFAALCEQNSIKFIGPKKETLEISGNKLECKRLVESRGVPVIPYTKDPVEDADKAVELSSEIGFPVLLKNAFGGGGRGIREARSKEEVLKSFSSSAREAKGAFGRSSLYIEKKLDRPRHIEVQVLASDSSTEAIHLGERECSIQRRYQKLIEISPSPIVGEEDRARIARYALTAANAVKYSNAGTVEFLRDLSSGEFYFIEINSRLQVEHPVTEMICGLDIVQSQIQVASGKSLPLRQKDVELRGAAIECRINAEDPYSDFVPITGKITSLHFPGGPGIRVDSALYTGLEVNPYYDSLLAKLIAWGNSFEQARARALAALGEFTLTGVSTTIPFHTQALSDPAFAMGDLNTSFIEEKSILQKMGEQLEAERNAPRNYIIGAFILSENPPTSSKGRIVLARDRIGWASLGDDEEGRFVDGI